jgi:hypothetical protein
MLNEYPRPTDFIAFELAIVILEDRAAGLDSCFVAQAWELLHADDVPLSHQITAHGRGPKFCASYVDKLHSLMSFDVGVPRDLLQHSGQSPVRSSPFVTAIPPGAVYGVRSAFAATRAERCLMVPAR